jgi:cell cycle sensor histidine kinase DivJ
MAISELGTQAAALVHGSLRGDARESTRHQRFILSRLLVGGGALALTPAYLAWRGTPGILDLAMIVSAAVLVLSVVLLSRTARLDIAHLVSAGAFCVFVVALAAATGGAMSPLLGALALVPVEAAGFGSRRFVYRAGIVALAALLSVVVADQAGLIQAAAPGREAMPLIVAAVLAQAVAAMALVVAWRSQPARSQPSLDPRNRVLLDHVGDLVTWHDASGGVVFANAAARALAGAEPQELLGRGLFERVHIADRPLFLKALSDAARDPGGATACFRTLFVPQGDPGAHRHPVALWLEMQAYHVADAGSQEPSRATVVCVMRDVTERRAREEQHALGHAEAVKANDVKNQFLATVSHELRTPLNAIIGFSEMLSSEEAVRLDPAKRTEYAGIIHASGHHLLDVVNTLLDISKIESGAMEIEREPVDLGAMVRECCALMALRAEQGSVELEKVIGAALPAIDADRRALKQVVLNLLSNAIKFTPPGGRVMLAVLRDGDAIDLSVSDTGIGIAAGDLPRLGDPFFPARGSYDRAHEGTGLGLSVVRGLVGLHGGQLTIESAPGAGTRVCVRLPMGSSAAEAEPAARIVTFARAPRRGIDTKAPLRLTA